jgi:predicted Mrr-cat superfamily restriction endonuclease
MPGDLIVLPLKTTSQVAIGHSAGPYQYRHDADPARRRLGAKYLADALQLLP